MSSPVCRYPILNLDLISAEKYQKCSNKDIYIICQKICSFFPTYVSTYTYVQAKPSPEFCAHKGRVITSGLIIYL